MDNQVQLLSVARSHYWEIQKRKKEYKLVKISKEEAMELNKRFNVAYGENGISHTYTRYQHYYLCENKRNMNCLEKIRKEKISNGKY